MHFVPPSIKSVSAIVVMCVCVKTTSSQNVYPGKGDNLWLEVQLRNNLNMKKNCFYIHLKYQCNLGISN